MDENEDPTSGGLWSRHDYYLRSVRSDLVDAWKAIGFRGGCVALLVGLPKGSKQHTKMRIEATGGPGGLIDLVALPRRVDALLDAADHDPLRAAAATVPERRTQLEDELRGRAVAEAIQGLPGNAHWTFFGSRSVQSDGLETRLVVGVEAEALGAVPQLPSDGPRRRDPVSSLVHALVEEALHRAWVAVLAPSDGDRVRPLGVARSELIRAAATRLLRAAFPGAGLLALEPDELLQAVSALPYEGRSGLGALVIANREDVHVDLQLETPIDLGRSRVVRKLIEVCDAETALLVSSRGQIYGLGRAATNHDDSVLSIRFIERGMWDLDSDDQTVLSVRNGRMRLPVLPLDIEQLKDVIARQLPGADIPQLVELALAAARHQHGAMLVISDDAAEEARRLDPQSLVVRPQQLSPALLASLTSMDGGVMVDIQGRCHAVGVILDGQAAGHGDAARGSRFHNALRYLGNHPRSVVIVYSSDGGIDILPSLRPRIARTAVSEAVRRYIDAIEANPPAFGPVFELRDRVVELSFYLSGEQCHDVNAATAQLKGLSADRRHYLLDMPDLHPNELMDDSYWLAT